MPPRSIRAWPWRLATGVAALVFVVLAVAADGPHPRRLAAHGVLFVVAVAAGLGTPLLGRIDHLFGPVLPVTDSTPAPGATGVPLDTTVTVRLPAGASSVEPTGGLSYSSRTSMRVRYGDRGILWLRPEPPGESGASGSSDGDTLLTFHPAPAFDPCRTVLVSIDAGKHPTYSFTFETACPAPPPTTEP